MLRRAGVNDVVMVSLSNYYYEHKDEYLASLYQSRQNGHNHAVSDVCAQSNNRQMQLAD